MIRATVSLRSCFCWLYRASSFSAAKNIISLILVLTIWWYHLLCCWKRVFAMSSVFSWQNAISLCLFHFVLQGQTCLLFQVSLDFLLSHSSPLWWKGLLCLVLVLEGVLVHHKTVKLQLLQHEWLVHRHWITLLWSETAPKNSISDSMRATPFLLRDSCPQ